MPNKVSNLRRFIHRCMVDPTSLIWSDCNLHHFILRGMVDPTSLIWSDRNLHRFTLRGMVDPTSLNKMECQYMKQNIFASQSTCMGVSVSLSCLFVHESPYQTTLVCCIPVFCRCLSRMDHPTIFHKFPRKSGAHSGSPQ